MPAAIANEHDNYGKISVQQLSQQPKAGLRRSPQHNHHSVWSPGSEECLRRFCMSGLDQQIQFRVFAHNGTHPCPQVRRIIDNRDLPHQPDGGFQDVRQNTLMVCCTKPSLQSLRLFSYGFRGPE
ncbi:hypothetical protein JQV27_04945 [Sulfitobacter mediterraneus]|nr:hypothetical protein [Sulfitobacter mediterraneus]MBM1644036.1 hypothetical protein [Sulfitobacter mediterraneus]MBM1656175.1 hypothetical protein [Sulfitobacter mediterraneus]MBM1664266.1 hypothetical protein [Sulfitobacter mediterraneus]MBM1684497.1 hypothetical protein [Sulfitobacter mediterraneus]MBM1696684.1 hypothetical protein [Sulfitobacter mediterraneus]